MVSTPEQILKKQFPDRKDCYYDIVVNGIEELSQIQILSDEKEDQINGSSKSDEEEPWSCAFNQINEYYKEILRVWPIIKLIKIEAALKNANGFDASLKVYQKSQFGVFLANTKMRTSIYQELQTDWDQCYTQWIIGTTKLLHPFTALSKKRTKKGIRQIVDEVILHPAKYYEHKKEFKKLVKRQYQLMLTEQNR